MAAKDNLSGQQFYHGTNADLKGGDVLKTGMPARHGEDNDKVWVADNAWEASKYGHRTYQVQPHSAPKKRGKAHEFHVEGATVLGDVSIDTIRDHANRAMAKGY